MTTQAPSGPVRTCLGCRERGSRASLLRVVVDAGRVIPDPAARLPGRGAWLHPNCMGAAERRKAFGRALRVASPDLGPLRAWLVEHGVTNITQG